MHQPLDLTHVSNYDVAQVLAIICASLYVAFFLTWLVSKILKKRIAKFIHRLVMIPLGISIIAAISSTVVSLNNDSSAAREEGVLAISQYLVDEYGITVNNSQATDLYNHKSYRNYDLTSYTTVEHEGESLEVGFLLNADGTYTLMQSVVSEVE